MENRTPLIAGKGAAEWGFTIDVDQPSSLGADRALNCIAAHDLVDQAECLIEVQLERVAVWDGLRAAMAADEAARARDLPNDNEWLLIEIWTGHG